MVMTGPIIAINMYWPTRESCAVFLFFRTYQQNSTTVARWGVVVPIRLVPESPRELPPEDQTTLREG